MVVGEDWGEVAVETGWRLWGDWGCGCRYRAAEAAFTDVHFISRYFGLLQLPLRWLEICFWALKR